MDNATPPTDAEVRAFARRDREEASPRSHRLCFSFFFATRRCARFARLTSSPFFHHVNRGLNGRATATSTIRSSSNPRPWVEEFMRSRHSRHSRHSREHSSTFFAVPAAQTAGLALCAPGVMRARCRRSAAVPQRSSEIIYNEHTPGGAIAIHSDAPNRDVARVTRSAWSKRSTEVRATWRRCAASTVHAPGAIARAKKEGKIAHLNRATPCQPNVSSSSCAARLGPL